MSRIGENLVFRKLGERQRINCNFNREAQKDYVLGVAI